MKMIGLLLFMIIAIVAITNLEALIDEQEGIPDVFSTVMPEKFVDPEEMKARETLQAPFAAAENAAQPVELDPAIKYDPLGDSINVTASLDVPHRHEAAVSDWLTEITADALTFSIGEYQDHMRRVSIYFSQNGWKEFQAFLQNTGVTAMMQSNGFELRTFVQDVPELRLSGAAGGRYLWLYDMPVSLTFLPVGASSYDDLETTDYKFEELDFRLQLARVPMVDYSKTTERRPGMGYEGLVIDTWEVLAKKKEQPAEQRR